MKGCICNTENRKHKLKRNSKKIGKWKKKWLNIKKEHLRLLLFREASSFPFMSQGENEEKKEKKMWNES